MAHTTIPTFSESKAYLLSVVPDALVNGSRVFIDGDDSTLQFSSLGIGVRVMRFRLPGTQTQFAMDVWWERFDSAPFLYGEW